MLSLQLYDLQRKASKIGLCRVKGFTPQVVAHYSQFPVQFTSQHRIGTCKLWFFNFTFSDAGSRPRSYKFQLAESNNTC